MEHTSQDTQRASQNQRQHTETKPQYSQKNQLYASIALNAVLLLIIAYYFSLPRPTLEEQVKQITQVNKSSSEALTKIKQATSWDSLKK